MAADDSGLSDVTAVVLAGGAGRRMGGVDKGLVEWRGRPLIEHVIERARPQVGALMISANRNIERYLGYGLPVVSDRLDDFQGPLAGFQVALAAIDSPWLATFPCDSPLAPRDLVARLRIAAERNRVPVACPHDGERRQPVFALIRADLADDLQRALERGERKIDRWFESVGFCEVDFSDQPQAFANANRPDDLDHLG